MPAQRDSTTEIEKNLKAHLSFTPEHMRSVISMAVDVWSHAKTLGLSPTPTCAHMLMEQFRVTESEYYSYDTIKKLQMLTQLDTHGPAPSPEYIGLTDEDIAVRIEKKSKLDGLPEELHGYFARVGADKLKETSQGISDKIRHKIAMYIGQHHLAAIGEIAHDASAMALQNAAVHAELAESLEWEDPEDREDQTYRIVVEATIFELSFIIRDEIADLMERDNANKPPSSGPATGNDGVAPNP